MTIRLNLALAAAAASLWAGAAQAQGVMPPGAVPPPPSLRDSIKPSESQGAKRRARRGAQAEAEAGADAETAAPRRRLKAGSAAPRSQGGGYSGQVDDRPQRAGSGGMQLEDDPRSVTPVLNNGRAGVGMRF